MLVYRYLKKQELEYITNGEIDKIGGKFTNKMSNDFNYDSNTKYIHFFKEYQSMY